MLKEYTKYILDEYTKRHRTYSKEPLHSPAYLRVCDFYKNGYVDNIVAVSDSDEVKLMFLSKHIKTLNIQLESQYDKMISRAMNGLRDTSFMYDFEFPTYAEYISTKRDNKINNIINN